MRFYLTVPIIFFFFIKTATSISVCHIRHFPPWIISFQVLARMECEEWWIIIKMQSTEDLWSVCMFYTFLCSWNSWCFISYTNALQTWIIYTKPFYLFYLGFHSYFMCRMMTPFSHLFCLFKVLWTLHLYIVPWHNLIFTWYKCIYYVISILMLISQ